MTSQRPYLLRAIHEWISDNGMTPHLLVDADAPGVHVPPGTAKDGKVVLNIAERAVNQLSLGNEYITFSARFGGVAHEVFVPVAAVLAVYARETGQGMALPDPHLEGETEADAEAVGEQSDDAATSTVRSVPQRPRLSSVPSDGAADSDDDETPPPAPEPSGRPRLRVVK